MAMIGYARVSTEEQHLDLQLRALGKAGCRKIFREEVSAVARHRPEFDAAMAALRSGDTFVVWKLDRAFRSLRQAIDVMDDFNAQGIRFRSLTEHIDTSTAFGEAMYQMQSVFAQLERRLISERTKAGMAEVKRQGMVFGPKPKLSPEQVATARELLADGTKRTMTAVADYFDVSPRTLTRSLKRQLAVS